MKKFKFPLETLLNVREKKIKKLGGELFENASLCHALKEKEALLKEKIFQSQQESKKRRICGDLGNLLNDFRHMEQLLEEQRELLKEKKACQKKLLQTQEKTMQAIQERKIVEKLKEKKYSLWEMERELDLNHEREQYAATQSRLQQRFKL